MTEDIEKLRARKDTTPSEPGKPEAVNLERADPISTAARRRDSFENTEAPVGPQDDAMPDRNPRSYTNANLGGKPGGASETTTSRDARNQQHLPPEGGVRQGGAFIKKPRDE